MKQYFMRNKLIFVFAVLVNAVMGVVVVGLAYVLSKATDIAMTGVREEFFRATAISMSYLIGLGVVAWLCSRTSKIFTIKIGKQMRQNIFTGIMKRDVEDYTSVNSADYLSAINNDVKLIEDNYIDPILSLFQGVFMFVAAIGLLIYFDPTITASVIGATVLMLLIPSLFGKVLQDRQDKYSKKLSSFMSGAKDFFSGYEVVRTYSMKRYVGDSFSEENDKLASSKLKVDKLMALIEGTSTYLSVMVQMTALFLSAYFIVTGKITAGVLLGVIQASGNLATPISLVLQSIPQIQGTKPIVDRLTDFADYSDSKFSGKQAPTFEQGIQVRDLEFQYSENEPVLKGISTEFKKGKKYAVIGKSGCGKTTMIRLLAGYYSGFVGSINYDSNDLHDLDIEKTNELSAIIHQNIYMFDQSIRDNICLHQNYSEEQLNEAVSLSGVNLFLDDKKTLNTPIGENGANLSGGQRQRVAVARALIQQKPIMVLDEGTSAIDLKTAHDIETRLLAMDSLTLITVTHALNAALLQKYDQIIFMDKGRIVAEGHYNELMRHCSAFIDYCQIEQC